MSNQLQSRSEIVAKLKTQANNAGYSGSVVDFIINLFATEYIDTLNDAVTILLESNGLTANSINSLLNLAAARNYSVRRGENDRYTIKVKSKTGAVIPKGTEVLSESSVKLFTAKDYDLVNSEEVTIELVASTSYINETVSTSGFYAQFLSNNLSDDVEYFDSEGNSINFVRNIREALHAIQEVTLPNWGSMLIYDSSQANIEVTLKGFTYLEEYDLDQIHEDNIRSSSLEIIPGSLTRIIKDYNSRETFEEIKSNYLTAINTLGYIRSNTDLIDLFKLRFSNSILNATFRIDNTDTKAIYFIYIPNELIGQEEFINFINDTKNYFLGNYQFILKTAIAIPVDIYMNIKGTSTAPDDIKELLSNYENFDVSTSPYELISEISKLDSVDTILHDWRITINEGFDYFNTSNAYLSASKKINFDSNAIYEEMLKVYTGLDKYTKGYFKFNLNINIE